MSSKLTSTPHVAFVPISDTETGKDKALAFYRDLLGLTLVEDQSPFALVFRLHVPSGVSGDLRENLLGEPGTGGEGISRSGNDDLPSAAGGTLLRATFAGDFKPQQFTILGWSVDDIDATAAELAAAGVEFNHYPFVQNDHPQGVWDAPGGTRIAWFNDPFGNVLSLQQDA
jgi:catechol 2,3-dioxygenase-like lactoylglutathione lyase family enzyme